MKTLTAEELQRKLAEPFENKDIEWRISATNKEKDQGLAVPYVTNRAIMNRLDETLGVDGWRNEFIPWQTDPQSKKSAQLCAISIFFPDRKEWITKSDGAENSDFESVKGGLSDSMKRAAVQWGIGRYLYGMPQVWVPIDQRGNSYVVRSSARPKLDSGHATWVASKFSTTGQEDTPPPETKTAPTPAPQPTPVPQSTATPQPASQTASDYYMVTGLVLKPSPKGGSNTSLQLQDQNQQTFHAFLEGVNPDLTPGLWLDKVILTQRNKNGVLYYTLTASYFEP